MNPLCEKMIRELEARRRSKRKKAEREYLAYRNVTSEKFRRRRNK